MKITKIHNLPSNIKAFTLVEMLVAMTIFGVIMVSVAMIYSISTQVTIKADINREMQQNIKSTIETIAEDVRKNKLIGVTDGYPVNFGLNKDGFRLKTSKYQYILFGYEIGSGETISDAIPRKNTFCNNIKNNCFIMKCIKNYSNNNDIIGPLSNSKTSISKFNFHLTSGTFPKLTINFTAKPSVKKGLASKLIEQSKIIFQTTLSERKLKIN